MGENRLELRFDGKIGNRKVKVYVEKSDAIAHYFENDIEVFKKADNNWTEDTNSSRKIIIDACNWLSEAEK